MLLFLLQILQMLQSYPFLTIIQNQFGIVQIKIMPKINFRMI